MANVPMHALTIAGMGMVLPMDILGSGGRIRKESGEDASPNDVIGGEPMCSRYALHGEISRRVV